MKVTGFGFPYENSGFVPSGGGSSPYISPLIAAWYDALSVKPSAALLTALNTLVDGMNSDGDWNELDFLAVSAGMETEEQALRPLKTTGNSVMRNEDVIGGSDTLIWGVNGFPSNGAAVLFSGFNPVSNGVKYVLNSAFGGFYGNTMVNSYSGGEFLFGGFYSADLVTYTYSENAFRIATTSISNQLSLGPHNAATSPTSSKAKANGNTSVPFYTGFKRTGANTTITFTNAINSSNSAVASTSVPDVEYTAFGDTGKEAGVVQAAPVGNNRIIFRACLFGSGSVSQTNTGNRLNTFFTARSLNPYV